MYNSINNETPYPSSNNTSSVKAFGALLIIAGIGADVVSMFMIGSGGFGGITIFGTIALLAWELRFSSHFNCLQRGKVDNH